MLLYSCDTVLSGGASYIVWVSLEDSIKTIKFAQFFFSSFNPLHHYDPWRQITENSVTVHLLKPFINAKNVR